MTQRLKHLLGSTRASWVITLLAVVLTAPSLTTGLVTDDHVQQLLLRSPRAIDGLSTKWLDLFSFASGDPQQTHQLMDAGVFPWWTDPVVRLSFWRPLSALTHALDAVLWPSSAVLMHAHSLLWFALALLSVARFYQRFVSVSWVAGLATLLYSFDDNHGPAVGWVANRNAMVALALALPVLELHDRARKSGKSVWLAALMLVVALLAGEASVAIVGYLVAYAWWLEQGPLVRRLVGLWPYALVLVAWRVAYTALGHGVFGSGVYFDVGGDPLGFLGQLPARALFLALGQLALPWSDFSSAYGYLGPSVGPAVLGFSVLAVAGFGVLVAPLLRAEPTARFFAMGSVLALVPIASTFSADRLLWFVGVGAMGLVALRLAEPWSRWARPACWALVVLHGVLAPLLLPIRSRSMVTVETLAARANDSVPKSAAVEGKTVVLVNPPSDALVGFMAVTRADRHEPRPQQFRWLASGLSAVTLFRESERSLTVTPERGFFEQAPDQMLRDPRRPLKVGERVELTGVSFEVTRVLDDGRPAEARATFTLPLEDPSLWWFSWGAHGYQRFELPAIGARVTLPALDPLSLMREEPASQ